MKSLRNVVGVVLAFALAAFAVPGLAQNNKTYFFKDYPAKIKKGENPGQVISIQNNSPSGNANFNSFRIVAPPGITFKSKPSNISQGYSAIISDPQENGMWVDVTNISPAVGAEGVFILQANLIGECGKGGKWIIPTSTPYTRVWSGSGLTGQEFFNKTNPDAATLVDPCWTGTLSCTAIDDTPNALTALTEYPIGQGSRFSASAGGATFDSQSGFFEGVRGFGNEKLGEVCTDINYAYLNNVLGGAAASDPLGNLVPQNGVSFVWDRDIAPNPIITYTVTWKSEWGDATTGLPTRQTQYCDVTYPALCTATSTFTPVKACLATAVVHSSIPPGEPGCVARETWTVVPAGDPYYCSGTVPTPLAVCLQVTSVFLDGKDPVFIR
jgi:hypothetical protein